MIADPAADIGDVYAWMAPDGRHVNLVMDIVARRFSDRLQYVLHVESGERFGETTASTTILCRFNVAAAAECWLGALDYLRGDASIESGLEGNHGRFRVFAGLRDDPFFNNVKGTRAAYNVAGAAIQSGAITDDAGCPRFDARASEAILDTWRHTDGGPATNFLAGWKTSALVISIDREVVNAGGEFLAVWGAVHKQPGEEPNHGDAAGGRSPRTPALGAQIQRTGRPLIKNGLVGGPLASATASNERKEMYNRVARAGWAQFVPGIEESLALYDGFDGDCGNQWLGHRNVHAGRPYEQLARLLADDRLWINSASSVCTQFLAVELIAFGTPGASNGDCGGRTPDYDANNIFRSLLANGTVIGVDDGLTRDERVHSTSTFPFLAAP